MTKIKVPNDMTRIKVPNEIKKEARKLFESGMDMFDIHQELKINLGTLYNMSSREKWKKGGKKELFFILEAENEIKKLAQSRESKLEEYRELTKNLGIIFKEIQIETHMQGKGDKKKEVRSLVKYKAEAAAAQAKGISTTYALDKELYNIRTPLEEIELTLARVRYETLKRELKEDKATILLGD